jgi:hypothetical protein
MSKILGFERRAWTGGTSLDDPSELSPQARKAFLAVEQELLLEQLRDWRNYWGTEPDDDTLSIFRSRARSDAWATIRQAFPEEEMKQRAKDSRYGNPLVRVKVNSPPQRPKGSRGAPSKRLRQRRQRTQRAPAGYYANPLEKSVRNRDALSSTYAPDTIASHNDSYIVQWKLPNERNWSIKRLFSSEREAQAYANGLARTEPDISVRVVKPDQRRSKNPAKSYPDAWSERDAPPDVYVGVMLNAGHDTNGNPRKGVLIVKIENLTYPVYKGFVDLGYMGVRGALESAGYGNIADMAVIGTFDISPTNFRRLKKGEF